MWLPRAFLSALLVLTHGCQKVRLPEANAQHNGSCLASVMSSLSDSLAYSPPYRCFRHCETCESACHATSIISKPYCGVCSALRRNVAEATTFCSIVVNLGTLLPPPHCCTRCIAGLLLRLGLSLHCSEVWNSSNENFGKRGRGKVGKGKVRPQISSLVFIVCQVPFAQAG